MTFQISVHFLVLDEEDILVVEMGQPREQMVEVVAECELTVDEQVEEDLQFEDTRLKLAFIFIQPASLHHPSCRFWSSYCGGSS